MVIFHNHTFVYDYFSSMPEIQKIPKNPKMSFNGQPNMFFGMFVSFTCDLHIRQDILNPLNIIFFMKWCKK